MASELEGLIAGLLVRVSCAGEQGCSVTDVLEAIRHPAGTRREAHENAGQDPKFNDGYSASHHRTATTIWQWLAARKDVSVGPNRKYNHLTLDEVLALPPPADAPSDEEDDTHEPPGHKRHHVRVYASEETMWESLTGHAVDYKRVPRSEWLLLLGIASKTSKGILQGDLGRLVDQDKRSVPKRTDALLRKGYIAKRTTLVRGTKTSKMWLKLFAPPLPKDGENTADEPRADMNITRQVLVANLDPVPWHIRWTGESIDYTALATTILAVAKEWGVLRMQDLKSKLGVLGMRWQMKVLAKVCRFLNARGVIQYVAAKLGDKVFKDCIKFGRDLNAEDWSVYLATGKRTTKKPNRSAELGAGEGDFLTDPLLSQSTNVSEVSSAPPWSLDKPLPATVVEMTYRFGDTGLTNPDVYGLTLGPSFSRYLSSMTTAISTANLQPTNLQHLQLRSEHTRAGKVASYRYFAQHHVLAANDSSNTEPAAQTQQHQGEGNISSTYGFAPVSASAVAPVASGTLTDLCELGMAKFRQKNRLKKAKAPKAVETAQDEVEDVQVSEPRASKEPKKRGRPRIHPEPLETTTLRLTLKVSPESLKALIGEDIDQTNVAGSSRLRRTRRSAVQAVDIDLVESLVEMDVDVDIREETPASSKKRGRGRRAADSDPASRPWKCEKCGGSWKNDIGLKYHLEKSRTSCNPAFGESEPTPRRGKNRTFPEPTHAPIESSAPGTPPPKDTPSGPSPTREQLGHNSKNENVPAPAPAPAPDRRLSEKRLRNKEVLRSRSPINLAGTLFNMAADWRPPPVGMSMKGLLPNSNGGALVESEDSQPRPVLFLSDLSNVESPSGKPGRRNQTTQNNQPAIRESAPDPETPFAVKPIEPSPYPELNGRSNDCEAASGTQETPAHDAASESGAKGKEKFTFVHEPLRELLGEQASEKNTESQALFGNGLSRSVMNHRIGEIIANLLAEQNGIFPGGKSLWHAITAIWAEKYPTDPAPTVKAYQTGLRDVLRKKGAAEHWHAFRDDRGMFSKCQIIIQPTLDPFSPEAMGLVDKIKETYPQLYMPPPFTAPPDLVAGKDFRRGRRNLASEVEVLSAPVYAAQASAKRRMDDDDEDASPNKRLKRSIKETDPKAAPQSGQKSDQVKWIAEGDRVAQQMWPKPFGAVSLKKPLKGFQFLSPNTYLEEDPPNRLYKTRPGPKKGSTNKPSLQKQHSFPKAFSGDAVFGSTVCVPGSNGSWPYLDMQYFESQDVGYTLSGWMPDPIWFSWATIVQEIEKRTTALSGRKRKRKRMGKGLHQQFINSIVACMDLEESWAEAFIGAPRKAAGPHNVFIRLFGGPNNYISIPSSVSWPEDGQLTLQSMRVSVPDKRGSSLSDEDNLFDWAEDPKTLLLQSEPAELRDRQVATQSEPRQPAQRIQPAKPKRVALVSRALTSLPAEKAKAKETQFDLDKIDEPDKLLAAFVAVRVLLGGSDKAIDWGLLLRIFPNIELSVLRRFWIHARKQQGASIAKLTKDFQAKFLAAYEREELPEIDFEDPLDYEWNGLIEWTLQLNRKDDIQLPSTRCLLDDNFSSKDASHADEDWQEKFFHAQASVYSRFEWATAAPAAISVDEITSGLYHGMSLTDLDVAKSWVRSLCCTDETQYSIQDIKDKFSTLAAGDPATNNKLLTQAIEQLTQQRIITKIRKPLFGGRPYRLNEWFTYMVGKLGQQAKYQEAATFKTKLDAVFRRGGTVKVPYTLDDGSVMALTNLNATGRIRLVPVNVPYIPFGFEPGNYESRKFPKSYYHFGMEAVPTETYLYSEDIDALQLADQEGPPLGSPLGELPQWVDFFGKRDVQRWMEVLGAFCFVYATRGFMTIEGICTALKPILEEYEAHIIIDWGKRTGVLKDSEGGLGTTVGEWWWLAVPWLMRSGQTGRVRAIDE
ncbi:Fc.00g053690.m01.CDS01 [Cosmosporella sp. VM-42]